MRLLEISTLPPKEEWVDADEVMLHACFEIFKECVDEEGVLEHANPETNKEWIEEAKALYRWWEERRVTPYPDDASEEADDKEAEMISRLMKIRSYLWT